MQEQDFSTDELRARLTRARRELQLACAELGLAHHALERHLPPRVKTGDVAWAMGQGQVIEEKLESVIDELHALTRALEAR